MKKEYKQLFFAVSISSIICFAMCFLATKFTEGIPIIYFFGCGFLALSSFMFGFILAGWLVRDFYKKYYRLK